MLSRKEQSAFAGLYRLSKSLLGEYPFYDEVTHRGSHNGNESNLMENGGYKMKKNIFISFRCVRIADFFNRRVIKTSYFRSAVYFGIAIAVFLLFYFLIISRL